jgi:hypothetical protein
MVQFVEPEQTQPADNKSDTEEMMNLQEDSYTVAVQEEEEESSLSFVVLQEDDTRPGDVLFSVPSGRFDADSDCCNQSTC